MSKKSKNWREEFGRLIYEFEHKRYPDGTPAGVDRYGMEDFVGFLLKEVIDDALQYDRGLRGELYKKYKIKDEKKE